MRSSERRTQRRKTPCDVLRAQELVKTVVPTVSALYMRVSRAERGEGPDIPFRRVGKKLIFFEEELLAWLDRSPGVRLEDIEK